MSLEKDKLISELYLKIEVTYYISLLIYYSSGSQSVDCVLPRWRRYIFRDQDNVSKNQRNMFLQAFLPLFTGQNIELDLKLTMI